MGLIRWGATGLMALIIAVVAAAWFLPASLAFRLIEPSLTLPKDIKVALPRGSLRAGHVLVQFRGFPPSRVSWQLQWPNFSLGAMALSQTISFVGPGHQITGALRIIPGEEILIIEHLNGEIHSSDINQLAGAYGHQFSGSVTLKNGSAQASAKCLTDFTGDLSWSGGRIALNGFKGVAQYQLPPLQANLDLETCSPALNLTRNADHLARFVLGLDGWFSAELQPRLLVLAQIPGAMQLKQPLLFEEKIL